MKILFLITRRQTRGAETFAVQLAEELHKIGHHIIIAGLYAPASTPLTVPDHLMTVDLSQLSPRPVPHVSILRKINQLVREENIELVQANASDNLKYAVLSRELFGWDVPLVYRNASIMSAWVRSGWHQRLTEWLLKRTDAVASVSEKSRVDIINSFNLPSEQVYRLGIAANVPALVDRRGAKSRLEAATGKPLSLNEKVIFHVGAFTAEKNHAGLLRAYSLIEQRYHGQTRLVSIGSGPLLENVKAHSSSGSTYFLGYRTDVPELLPAADLLLLPSLIEGTPGVILEAGANSVVALANRVGAVNECYPENLVGELTVEKGKEQAMADKAILLLENDARRAQIADVMRAFVQKHYEMASIGQQFITLYEGLLAKKY